MKILPLLLLCAGCTSIFGPEVEHWSKRPLDPVPTRYAELYAAVERCWDHKGDFGAVNWYVADKITVNTTKRARGTTRGDDITIARQFVNNDRTVMHEASHHVTGLGDLIHYDNATRAVCDDALTPTP